MVEVGVSDNHSLDVPERVACRSETSIKLFQILHALGRSIDQGGDWIFDEIDVDSGRYGKAAANWTDTVFQVKQFNYILTTSPGTVSQGMDGQLPLLLPTHW
jgi:hypothetical protein